MSIGSSRTWCCNHPLSTGVKYIAFLNLAYSLGLIVTEVVLCYTSGIQGVQELNPEFSNPKLEVKQLGNATWNKEMQLVSGAWGQGNDEKHEEKILSVPALQFTVSLVWILTWILDIFFSLFLYHAAVTRNKRHCEIWFYFRCSALVFRVIFLIIYVIAGFSILPKIPVIVLFAVRLYSLWVVSDFIKELAEDKRLPKASRADLHEGASDSKGVANSGISTLDEEKAT